MMTDGEKYQALLKDIAAIITETSRNNYLLNIELDETKKQLAHAYETLERYRNSEVHNA